MIDQVMIENNNPVGNVICKIQLALKQAIYERTIEKMKPKNYN